MRQWTVTLCLIGMAAASYAGTYYEAVTQSTADQGGMNSRVTAWIDGDSAKIVFTESDNPILGEGGYLLTNDGARSMVFVNPEEGTYMEWDLQAMMGGLGGAMQGLGAMVKMEFANAETKLVSRDSGGDILGLSTTLSVVESSYDMTVKVMGMGQQSRVETRQEIWTTTELTDAGFGAWLRKDPPVTGIEGLDEVLAQQADMPEGFPLKSVVTTTTTDKKRGRTQTQTMTTEVVLLREESIDPAVYELDPSLTRTEMPSLEGLLGNQ